MLAVLWRAMLTTKLRAVQLVMLTNRRKAMLTMYHIGEGPC